MILVTLGTHPQPMDRLIRRLDELHTRGELNGEVVVQAAAVGFQARQFRLVPVLPHEELMALIREAEVVISHAGPGSLAEVRSVGKVPVVVPRLRAYGEHVDDHQARYARRLRGVPGYVVVESLDDLPRAIETARRRSVQHQPADVARAVAILDEIYQRR